MAGINNLEKTCNNSILQSQEAGRHWSELRDHVQVHEQDLLKACDSQNPQLKNEIGLSNQNLVRAYQSTNQYVKRIPLG